jgi:Cu(I)/Ag(I) efflux system membrane fusion protein
MSKLTIPALLLAAAALAVGGYRVGAGHWPAPEHALAQGSPAVAGRTVLYWRDPDGKADYSATEKKTPDGRAYLPVYDGEEPDLVPSKAAEAGKAAKTGARKVLYYRNPMGLPDTSPTPKKDSMGMDYIAVYEGDDDGDGSGPASAPRRPRYAI